MAGTEENETQGAPNSALAMRHAQEAKEAKELACKLTDMVNTCGGDDYGMKCLVQEMLRNHRTLQQAFFSSFVMKLIETVANWKTDVNTDGRNEQMKKTCDLIYKALEEHQMTCTDEDGNKRIYGMPFI